MSRRKPRKNPQVRPSMITDSNQVCFVKMTGRRLQEGSQYQTFRGWKIISQPIRGRQGFVVSLRHEHPTEFTPKAQAEGKTNIHAGVLKG